MAKSRTKYIGVGTTILSIGLLLGWFSYSDNFDVEVSGDILCSDTCISYFNITSKYYNYYIYNKESIKLNFDKEIKAYAVCKPDKRCKHCGNCPEGWREIDFTSPYTSRYKYVYKFYKGVKEEFMIIGWKESFETVKWGLDAINKEIDPIWYGINITKLCNWRTETKDVNGYITYNYTCSTDYFNYTTNPFTGYCYNKTWNEFNQTDDYHLIRSQEFTSWIKPKTIFWEEWEKIGEEKVEVCNKVTGARINNYLINFTKYNLGFANKGTKFCIWTCQDGDCMSEQTYEYAESRINKKKVGGWSGKCADFKEVNWHKVKLNLDSNDYGIGDVIEKV